MKLAPILAAALLAGCATSRQAGPAPAGAAGPAAPARILAPDPEAAAISRAMSEIEDAERRGALAGERARWTAAAAAAGQGSAKARFLALYAMPHNDETWSEYRALAAALPTSALGEIGMARIYVEWNVLDQVEPALGRALAAEPGNWLADLVRAQADERRERWDEAAAGYRRVVAVDPGNVAAHVGLARLARRAADPAAARAEAELALAALPQHAPALDVLSGLAADGGDPDAAVAIAYQVVAASPRDRAARVTLARLLKAKGDAAASRDQWKAALAIREDAEGLVALAEVSRLAGDRASEEKALDRLAQLDPGSAEWKRIAEIRTAAGDLDGAEKALRRSLARDPKDAPTNLALGRVVLQAGKPQEALELLRAAGADGAADRAALERRLNVERTTRPDVAAIQKAVGALIDRTYRARLKELPRLSGHLTVRATVDGAGGATLVEVLEDSVHDDDVRACAYWNLKDAAYPTDRPGRYSFSFSLRPGR
ncbi:MAG: tetratricopeptide repeat protein [Anaeromyxobacter sp.]|nr:tetratricopeptide repeat protein [Anaeromyxobacter sp.]